MKLVDVTPIGTSTAPAFVDGPDIAELRMVTRPTYPASPEAAAFRKARIAAECSLRAMSTRLGISAVALSQIEHGSMRPEDWAEFWRLSGLASNVQGGSDG
jgi:hypothetical protein